MRAIALLFAVLLRCLVFVFFELLPAGLPPRASLRAEGLTLHDGRCVQLLWHGGKGLVRDPKTFKVQHQFELPEGCDQGWGLTHDGGEQLFLSDGAAACTTAPAVLLARLPACPAGLARAGLRARAALRTL